MTNANINSLTLITSMLGTEKFYAPISPQGDTDDRAVLFSTMVSHTDHDALLNYDETKHRSVDDTSTSTIAVLSANKIDSTFAKKTGDSGGQTFYGGTGAGEDLTLSDNSTDGNTVTVSELRGAVTNVLNNQTGTSYTLALSDKNKIVTLNNASEIALTIPSNASVAYPVGTQITLVQLGVGQVAISIDTDTLISLDGADRITAQNGKAILTKLTSTTWLLAGEIATGSYSNIIVIPLGGQSNMVGWHTDNASNTYPSGTKQYAYSSASLIDASSPLDHWDENPGTMGLARQFAIDYVAANPTKTIWFIPAANGGTSFQGNNWNPGDPQYNYLVNTTNSILSTYSGSTLGCILWHQGEHDNVSTGDIYRAALHKTIQSMRHAITGAVNVPFILGEIKTTSSMYNAAINDVIKNTPTYCYKTYTVDTQALALFDGLHFSNNSLDTMGSDYYSGLASANLNTQVTAESGAAAHYILGSDNQLYYDLNFDNQCTENDVPLTHQAGYSTVQSYNDGLDSAVAETAGMTMCFVVRHTTQEAIIGGTNNGTNGISLFFNGGALKFVENGGLGTQTIDASLDNNEWYFVALSVQSDGTYTGYRGGETPATITGTGSRNSSTRYIGIGDNALNSASFPDNLEVAEAIFFNSYKDTAALSAIYANSRTRMSARGIDVYYSTALVFAPSDISGYTSHWDFSDSASITLNGSDISQINDQNGTYHMTQGSASLQPTVLSAAQNGLDVADFDGSDDRLEASPMLPANSSYTKAVVVKFDNLTNPGNTIVIGRSTLWLNSGSNVNVWHNLVDEVTGSTTLSAGTWYIIMGTYDAATSDAYLYIDNVEDGSNLSAGAWDLSENYAWLGDIYGGNCLNGQIAEAIVYNNAISSGDRTSLYNHLKTKWGL